MGTTPPAGPTKEEKERFLNKINEWQKLGFATDELENLLENDFNEFLRRRHEILKYQVDKKRDAGSESSEELLTDMRFEESTPVEREHGPPEQEPEFTEHGEPAGPTMTSLPEPTLELEPETEEDLLLLGEPIPPEDEEVLEPEEESVIFVGKLPRTPKSKVHKTREIEKKETAVKETDETESIEEESVEPADEDSAEELDEYERELEFEEEEEGIDEEDYEDKPSRKSHKVVSGREDHEQVRGSAGGKIGAVAVVIIIILASYYFFWVMPSANEEPGEVSANFEIRPNTATYEAGKIITFDGSYSSGKKLKYQWTFDDDFKVTEGSLKSDILRGYFIATENEEKSKTVILKVTGEDNKDILTKELSLKPQSFELSEERLDDRGEYKVNGYLDIRNKDGITTIAVPEYDADITINRINIEYHTKDSKPMSVELKESNNINDGFRQSHSTYERTIQQDLILSGTVSGVGDVRNPPFGLPGNNYPFHNDFDGSMSSTDKSYTDLTTFNVIYGKATNNMDITIPIEFQGTPTDTTYSFSSDDVIESYPELNKNPMNFRLIDLANGPLKLGDKDGVYIGNVIYLWDAEKIEYMYERPVIKVNLTIDNSTKTYYKIEEFFLTFWIAEDISQPVKTHLYSVLNLNENTTTLDYKAMMTSFSEGTSALSSRSCTSSTPDGHYYSRFPGYNYTSNWDYLPPTGSSTKHSGGTTSFDGFTPNQAIGIVQNNAEFNSYQSSHPNCYVVSGECTINEDELLEWNLTFGTKASKDGFNAIISEDGSITSKSIDIDAPPNSSSDFNALLSFAGSEDIFMDYDDEGFYDNMFEPGVNSENWLDFNEIRYGVETNMIYPNVDITSIMFVEHSEYTYVATYEKKSGETQNIVLVALDAETGQLLFYWDHSDDGLNIF
jgi:hypothetical protein